MTPQINKAMGQLKKCCNDWRPSIEYLERLATVHPEIVEQVKDLRSKLEFGVCLCDTHDGIIDEMRRRNG